MTDLEKKELKRIKKENKLREKKEKKEVKKAIKLQKEDISFSKADEKEFNKEEKRNRPLSEKELKIKRLNEPPALPMLEEIGNSVTHGVGAIFGLIALVLLVLKSDTTLKMVSSIVYGTSIFIMMLMSCLYHAWPSGSRVKRLWRRFDYSSIYLLICATFAPIQLVDFASHDYTHFVLALVWFSLMWAGAITGITLTCIFGPGRIRWLNYPMYFTLGWSGVLFIPGWFIHGNLNLLYWILGGGIVYTLGMIPFARRGKTAAHFIWHIFVLLGVVTHFLGIYFCIYS